MKHPKAKSRGLAHQRKTGTFFATLLVCAFSPWPTGTFGQDFPRGRFLADSIRIGSPVLYSLSYRHPPSAVVIFPDTNYPFAPFELVRKQYFPTRTNDQGSLDSVVYTLVSFEVDAIQRLNLPVYVISERDSTPVFADPDSVYLRPMITGPLDTLSLKANARYLPLARKTNYLIVVLVLAGLAVLAGLFLLVFGGQIRKRFRLYQLEKRHAAFLQQFQEINGGGPAGVVPEGNAAGAVLREAPRMEKRVALWKKYIGGLAGKPYSTYTTKEISDSIPEKPLAEALRLIDRTVYGGLPLRASPNGSPAASDPAPPDPFQTLKDFAGQLYEKRRREIIDQLSIDHVK
ncbi:MAG: hypothetical protein H7Z75_17425 [Ferruginibacter sp.]|nr:hypothetical protein [Cytophagales bacterium]